MTLARLLGGDFEQRIACLSASGEIYQQLLDDHVQVHQLGTGGEGIANPLLHLRLHRLIRHFRPQILHGAIFEGMTWGALGGLLQRTPVVLLEETSHPNGTAPESMRRSPRGDAAVRFFAKRVSGGIVAVAPRIGEYLIREVGVPSSRVHVILNGIHRFDVASPEAVRAERQRLGFPEGTFVLGAVGRIHEEHKRFGDLLEAVKRLREAHPVRAIIVGDGPDLPALKDRARFLGVDTHVVFAGRREDRELFFGLMDAFVLSSATEAAPLALMEAMMAGLPAVATTVGGVEDIAIDRETALLVPPNDVERLAAAIASLVADPVLRQSIAARAREHAVQHLSAERYAADVRALYLSELDRAAARGRG